jgi:hypothetical protein
MTVDELVKALKGDTEGVEIVFNDGVTEYTYGVRLVHVGVDHVLLTYDTSKEFVSPDTNRVLKEK